MSMDRCNDEFRLGKVCFVLVLSHAMLCVECTDAESFQIRMSDFVHMIFTHHKSNQNHGFCIKSNAIPVIVSAHEHTHTLQLQPSRMLYLLRFAHFCCFCCLAFSLYVSHLHHLCYVYFVNERLPRYMSECKLYRKKIEATQNRRQMRKKEKPSR